MVEAQKYEIGPVKGKVVDILFPQVPLIHICTPMCGSTMYVNVSMCRRFAGSRHGLVVTEPALGFWLRLDRSLCWSDQKHPATLFFSLATLFSFPSFWHYI